MGLQLHVSGTVHVLCDTGAPDPGTGRPALQELGVSVDGITLSLTQHLQPIYVDHYGPECAFDAMYFLSDATASLDLCWWDDRVLARWLPGLPNYVLPGGVRLPPGTFGAAGYMVVNPNPGGTRRLTNRLILRPATAGGLTSTEPCWHFPHAVLVESSEVKLGVKASAWRLKFKAFPEQVASSSEGAVLYDFQCQ